MSKAVPTNMHWVTRGAGLIAPIVAIGGILVAVTADPTFSWTNDGLSHLGVRTESAAIFRAALAVGGLLGGIYGVGLWHAAASIASKAVGLCFAAASMSLAGVGIFVMGHPLHQPAAIGFFGLVMVTFAVDAWHRTGPRAYLTLSLLGLLVCVWGTWAITTWPGPGLALPEFLGAVLVAIWLWIASPAPAVAMLVGVHPANRANQ